MKINQQSPSLTSCSEEYNSLMYETLFTMEKVMRDGENNPTTSNKDVISRHPLILKRKQCILFMVVRLVESSNFYASQLRKFITFHDGLYVINVS